MIWLWRDTSHVERIAAHLQATFWYVLPSLPMFLMIPGLLRAGWPFWVVLPVAMLAGAGFGAAWALIPAWLQAESP